MADADDELATTERAYRKAMFKLIFHLGFVVICCLAAAGLRGMFGLPPAFLSAVLIVALLLFSPDIFRFMVLRNKLQRLRAEQDT
jgi:hypothetical protein